MNDVILSIVSMMSCTSRKHHEYNARAIVCKGSDEVGIHSTLGGFLAEVEADTGVLGALENLWNMVLEDAGWETELKRAVAHKIVVSDYVVARWALSLRAHCIYRKS